MTITIKREKVKELNTREKIGPAYKVVEGLMTGKFTHCKMKVKGDYFVTAKGKRVSADKIDLSDFEWKLETPSQASISTMATRWRDESVRGEAFLRKLSSIFGENFPNFYERLQAKNEAGTISSHGKKLLTGLEAKFRTNGGYTAYIPVWGMSGSGEAISTYLARAYLPREALTNYNKGCLTTAIKFMFDYLTEHNYMVSSTNFENGEITGEVMLNTIFDELEHKFVDGTIGKNNFKIAKKFYESMTTFLDKILSIFDKCVIKSLAKEKHYKTLVSDINRESDGFDRNKGKFKKIYSMLRDKSSDYSKYAKEMISAFKSSFGSTRSIELAKFIKADFKLAKKEERTDYLVNFQNFIDIGRVIGAYRNLKFKEVPSSMITRKSSVEEKRNVLTAYSFCDMEDSKAVLTYCTRFQLKVEGSSGGTLEKTKKSKEKTTKEVTPESIILGIANRFMSVAGYSKKGNSWKFKSDKTETFDLMLEGKGYVMLDNYRSNGTKLKFSKFESSSLPHRLYNSKFEIETPKEMKSYLFDKDGEVIKKNLLSLLKATLAIGRGSSSNKKASSKTKEFTDPRDALASLMENFSSKSKKLVDEANFTVSRTRTTGLFEIDEDEE